MLTAATILRVSAAPANANAHANKSTTYGASTSGASIFASALDAIRHAAMSACAFVRDTVQGLAQHFTKRSSSTPSSADTTSTTTTSSAAAMSVTAAEAMIIDSTAPPVPAITVLLQTPAVFMNDNSTTASEIALRRSPYRPVTDTYTTYVQMILSAPWLVASSSTSPSPSSPTSASTVSSTVDMATLVTSLVAPEPEDWVFHGDSSSPWHPLGQPLPVDDLLVPIPSRSQSADMLASRRAAYAASPWRQALWAAKCMKQAAGQRAIAPRPRDPVTHDCSCGWCPDGTAAYELCAAVTIRRTMRSFGPRASSSGSAGASVARRVSQRSCAALAFAPPRFGRARG